MQQSIFILALLCFSSTVFAQSAHQLLRKGNKDYDKQEYTKAEEKYRKSLEQDPSKKSKYNLGNAVYQQEKYKEAIKHYEEIASSATNKQLKAKAYHNLGNAYINQAQQGEKEANPSDYLNKAVNAYKESLRNNPKDLDTKHNLSMAIQQLRKMQQQQQQKQNQNGDSDKKQQQNKDKQDSKKQDQKQQDKQQQQQQQNQDQQKEDKKKQEQQQKGKQLNREEAKKLLQIMNDEEKKVQEKIRRTKGSKRNSSKDW